MILVTGAAGFIGHHLVKGLRAMAAAGDGESIAAIDIANMDDLKGEDILTFKADIRSEKDMTDVALALSRGGFKVSACIHLAAIASPPIAQRDPDKAWSTNVQGTHNVLQLLRDIKCPRVIFFSSAHVYGISPRYMPTDENHPLALHDTYTTTKIIGEQICRLFHENHDISYAVLRLWNAYGPGQSPDYFIGKKISQAKAGNLTIRNEGVTKDWIHVSDVVSATIAAMKSNYVGPLNVGTGVETSLGTIIKIISESFGGIPIVPENVPDEGPTRMQADSGRIRRMLDWKPRVSFQEGLDDLIRRSKSE